MVLERTRAADARLVEQIRAVHTASDGTYGVPRVTAELRDRGQRVNHKRIARVMAGIGPQGLRLRRRHRTTIPDPAAAKAADLIGRDFTAPAVNRRYVGDITYLPVGERGFLYLATVIDLHSRRLAGYAIADHMCTDLVIDALHVAARTRGQPGRGDLPRRPRSPIRVRSLRQRMPGRRGARLSMSAVGSSADNATAESFNATLKRETLQGRRAFTDERDARLTVFRWLHRYNTLRRHSRLGHQAPISYEMTTRPTSTMVAQAA